ncbi:aminomethyl-transferring glycine dehydrogenase subunit GcvPB [Candidatus Entotheonella palauensis]|uniref:aminomethyl-transferring glycine dehydrogenase subunit GcvPB n=1 Tax=Candidatus Entotheonella palauensis TaxID=93172 RepID=UPI000B7D0D06|nr:aminomethyl-transferring glycine dehydrogenase subunit GcvPB [Candidatus Entotheonella palauensis]
MSNNHIPPLPYDSSALPRERARHYIPVTDREIQNMCAAVGVEGLDDLFHHIPPDCRLVPPLALPEELPYDALYEHMVAQSAKNRLPDASFVGDALPHYAVHDLVPFVAGLRELLTAYTPYQPERSQGTLMTQWLYQSCLVALTEFEAINASQYDRATALVEALHTAARLSRHKRTHFLLAGSLFPQDVEVVRTLLQDTLLTFDLVPIDTAHGIVALAALEEQAAACGEQLAGIVFPQAGSLGCLEDVDRLTDLAHAQGAKAIVVIDPMLLATGGLKPPGRFGSEGQGADLLVGEGQPLAIAPHFGGPGLGIFGVRFNRAHRQDIRSAPGRFVGAGTDREGRAAKLLVLSTREQHIRREKATSNICTNQGFVTTLAAAAILGRGEQGMQASCARGHEMARLAARTLTRFHGVELAFPQTPFWNTLTVTVPGSSAALIEAARQHGIHLGVDVSARLPDSTGNHLQLSFSDVHTPSDIERLSGCLTGLIGAPAPEAAAAVTGEFSVPASLRRQTPAQLPDWDADALKTFFAALSEQNISPDLTCYPLGSCTMKYNPYLHEAVANLPGFAALHPEAPVADIQGTLEVLYEIQTYFKAMTGLAAVTTQPVAGAQGELVGLKLFQAYHRSRGETRGDMVLIPHSAHGTNPATATMAGFETMHRGSEVLSGVVEIEAGPNGQMNLEHVRELLARYPGRVAGVMITNPNTSGVFELHFRQVADLIHEDGGLVYMDGANMNAIAGWVDLGALGVDAVHNNLHKTWSIPHGGGGPGDAIVAVSERLVPFLPGDQVVKTAEGYVLERAPQSIGSVHRHFGNVAHKIRAYTYLRALGREGVRRMSAMAVLAARYVHTRLKDHFPTLPEEAADSPRMHEFIITLPPATFERLEAAGIHRNKAIGLFGKLFLDFGFHAPTVSFPEAEGLMIEPTESYTQAELDRFADAVILMLHLVDAQPTILLTVPHFTPVDKIDDVAANKQLVLSEPLMALPEVPPNRIAPAQLAAMPLEAIAKAIQEASSARLEQHH